MTAKLYPPQDPRTLEHDWMRALDGACPDCGRPRGPGNEGKCGALLHPVWAEECAGRTITRLRQRVAELEARYETCHCGAALEPRGPFHCNDCPEERELPCPSCRHGVPLDDPCDPCREDARKSDRAAAEVKQRCTHCGGSGESDLIDESSLLPYSCEHCRGTGAEP